jgi:cytoskeletal protein CcmA (bactofilin family)
MTLSQTKPATPTISSQTREPTNSQTLLSSKFAMKLILSLLLATVVNAGTYTETIELGNAKNFVVLAKTGIATVPDSTIVGSMGVSPIATTAMTGFGLKMDPAGMHATASQITGNAYGADMAMPTPAVLTQSVLDMQTAYTNASLRTTDNPRRVNVNGGNIGGLTLTPGVYTFTTGVNINSDIILRGESDDVFIIQTTGVLTLATSTKVFLDGGVQAKNVFWVVAGNVSLGASSYMQGVILCKTNVVMVTASALTGRILAQTEVALQKAQVTEAKVDVEAFYSAGIDLGAACGYAVLSKSGISTVPTSTVIGNIGVSPIATTAITGFSLSQAALPTQFALSSQVDGEAHGADMGAPVSEQLTLAVLAMQAAYTDAASRLNDDETRKNVGGGDIGGLTLTPGVYTFTTAILITDDIILEGGADDVFIFQCTAVLSQSVNTKVILSGGVQAKNVIWQNAGNVKIQPGAFLQGIILCKTDVAIETGASVNGAIMAQTAVALQKATVTSGAGMCDGPVSLIPALELENVPVVPVVVPVPAPPTPEVKPVVKTVDVKTAANYAVLSEESISTKSTSTVTGNMGISPATSLSITNFGLVMNSNGEFSISSQVSGKVFAADYDDDIPQELIDAINDFREAFIDAVSRLNSNDMNINVGGGEIGNMTLEPGVYTFTISPLGITINGDLTLNGGPNDVFIIRTNGPLVLAPDTEVILIGGVKPENVFWVVADDVTVGTDAELQGVVMAEKSVTFEGGSTLEGRILAKGAVELDNAVIGTEEAFCA